MTDAALAAATTATEPDGAPRLPALDVLRGIAILGILFMNVNDMGASLTASFGDVRHLGWGRADRVAWWVRAVAADGTARGMLEMLFGAGMVILTGRLADAGDRWAAARRYAWRNLVLFGFGLVHVLVLLWPGDILHTYAIAALVAFPLRRLPPRLLLAFGLSLTVVQFAGGIATYLDAAQSWAAYQGAQANRARGAPLTAAQKAAVARYREEAQAGRADAREVAAEDRARSGTAASWIAYQWHAAASLQADGVEPFVVWEAAATMLIGAALFKLGWLGGGLPARWYLRAALAAYLLALAPRIASAADLLAPATGAPRLGWTLEEAGRLLTTFGHVSLINGLIARVGLAQRLLAPFRAAGQAALTLYILQTILCLWVLYPPWGLALYGRSGWAALMGTALAVDAGLLVLANLWLRRFRIAPVEWAWRSLVAGRRLAFRRRPELLDPEPLPAV